MNKINIGNAPAYTSPNSMTLICTEKPDGSTNLATLAFWAFASTNPGKIMFSLNKGAYSLELLAEKKEAVLAIPGVELTGALIGCGTCSGRDTDKAAQVGLTMQEVEGTNIKEMCIRDSGTVGSVSGSMGGVGSSSFGTLITIQHMIVRSEDDIRRISQELYNLIQTGSRAQGRFSTA